MAACTPSAQPISPLGSSPHPGCRPARSWALRSARYLGCGRGSSDGHRFTNFVHRLINSARLPHLRTWFPIMAKSFQWREAEEEGPDGEYGYTDGAAPGVGPSQPA